MSDLSAERETDQESLADWTLVDHGDESLEDDNGGEPDGENSPPEEEEQEGEKEEEDEEEGESEEEEDDVVSLGQKVEEVKDGDTESLNSETTSPESKLRKRRSRKSEATQDEETDLSLASCPSLPDDLPAIKPDSQYVHHPDKELNTRLNVVVALTIACVLGLGLGHFVGLVDFFEDSCAGWSSRSLWEENLNAAQVLESLKAENVLLEQQISTLQAENLEPIRIKGREGKEARALREHINHLITENEDMRLALGRHHFSTLPGADKAEFNIAAQENHHLRTTVAQLKHLGPDLHKLQSSVNALQNQHHALLVKVGKVRYEQPVPKELTPLVKQLEEMKLVVAQEAKKPKPPSSIYNAKSYITFMSQVISAFTSIHNFDERSAIEKIDLAKDALAYLFPKGLKVSGKLQQDILIYQEHFSGLKKSLQEKWKQLKDLTKPEAIVDVGKSTVSKMNRVIVNVVNKVKEIAQSTIMNSNKQIETSVVSLSDNLSKLNRQFEEAWKSLEIRKDMRVEETNFEDDGDDDEELNDDEDTNLDVDDTQPPGDDSDNTDETPQPQLEDSPQKKPLPKPSPPATPQGKPLSPTQTPKDAPQRQKHRKEQPNNVPKKHEGMAPTPSEELKAKPPLPPSSERVRDAKGRQTNIREEKKDDQKRMQRGPGDRKDKTLMEDDSRYFKGQYNKFDKNKVPTDLKRKLPSTNDDDDSDKKEKASSGLRRHWDKPQGKKSIFRDEDGVAKKQFIPRRGKKDSKEEKWEKKKHGRKGEEQEKWDKKKHERKGEEPGKWEKKKHEGRGEEQGKREKKKHERKGEESGKWEKKKHEGRGEKVEKWDKKKHEGMGEEQGKWEKKKHERKGEEQGKWEKKKHERRGEEVGKWDSTKERSIQHERRGEEVGKWDSTKERSIQHERRGEERGKKERKRKDDANGRKKYPREELGDPKEVGRFVSEESPRRHYHERPTEGSHSDKKSGHKHERSHGFHGDQRQGGDHWRKEAQDFSPPKQEGKQVHREKMRSH